jgi:hypothetical protein
MDFGEVLTKAWKIVWKFKILWIFGIFASCGTRSGGSYNGGSSNFQTGGTPGQAPNLPPGLEDNLYKFLNFVATPAFLIGFIILICVLLLLTVFFSIIGRIGLIKGAVDADAGAEHLGFGELWKSGLQYFWRFLGLSLLIGSPIIIFYLGLVIGGFFILVSYISGSRDNSFFIASPILLALLPVVCVLICFLFLFAIVIGFISTQAERAIVIENEGILSGLRRGWNVLIKNLGPILIIWIITVVIAVVAGFLIGLPLLLVVVPAFIAFGAAAVAGNGNNLSFMPLIIAGLCAVAYTPVSLVAYGILTTYTESVWTLTYLRLTKQDVQAPLTSTNA